MLLNSVMLAGIGGAAVPLVLHLLSRARYRSVDWGAMMFLEGADSNQWQSTRLKQWLLLLLRMAIVALLAVALAQPVARGQWTWLAQEGRVIAVILVDVSASMGFDENGPSRLQLAQDAARQVISNLRKEDRITLLLLGQEQSESDLQPSSDRQAVLARVDNLTVGHG